MTSDPLPIDHATFVHATLVHATYLCATFVHPIFVQGQNLVVYNCNHSCLDQTRTWSTPANAELGTAQPQLVLVVVVNVDEMFLRCF